MSEVFKQVAAIEEADIQAASVASLRDAPNRGGTYGADGLTAQQLKAKFDALPRLVKDKLHELIAAYNTLVASITSGALGDALMVSGVDSLTTLPKAIDKVASDLLGTSNDNTITTLAMLSAAIGDDPNFKKTVSDAIDKVASDLLDAIDAKSAVKVNGEHVSEFDASKFAADLIDLIVDDAPDALNTIKEIADALGGDPNFVTAIIENAKKAAAEAAKQAVDGKLDKVNDRYRLYATNGSGEQVTYGFSTSLVKSTFPMRKGNGEIETGTAKAANDAVPLGQMNEALAENDLEIDILRKRVVNLEQGITPDPYHTDDSVAYVKDIPANALPYARLEAVGGMTHKIGSELPIDEAYLGDLWAQDTEPQRTVGLIVDMFPGAEVGKTYTLAYDVTPSDLPFVGYLDPSGKFTLTANTELVTNCSGTYDEAAYTTFSNVRLIGESTVLRETKVKAIESVGKNLFDEKAVTGGVNGGGSDLSHKLDTIEQTGEFIRIKVGGSQDSLYMTPNKMFFAKGQRVAVSADVFVPSTVTDNRVSIFLAIVSQGTPATNVVGVSQKPTMDTWVRVTGTITILIDGFYSLRLQSGGLGNDNDFRIKNITVTTDTTATEYIPYRKHTFPIPAEVQDLDGYGWGIPEGAHNGIEFDDEGKAVYVKRVERKVLASADSISGPYQHATLGAYFSTGLDSAGVNSTIGKTVVCNKFNSGIPNSSSKNGCYYSNAIIFFTGDYKISTRDEWKAQLAAWEADGDPLVLYYELATPIVTDVSAYFSRDNFIEVEGGGVIIAQNENADAAPTAIKYQLKEG